MTVLVMVSQLLLGLSLLVAVHEFGHFIAAKAFGMRVPKFYIFFDAWGKKLWSKQIGDTEYGIGWLPLGGYVQISGMIDETQDASQFKEEPEEWEFRAKPAWQRFIVMIAGIVMNVITGVLIFAMFFNVFDKDFLSLEEVNKEGVFAHELAQQIGIETGDRIVAVNGHKPDRFRDVSSSRVFLGGSLTIQRGNEIKEITTPRGFFKNMGQPFVSPMRELVGVSEVMAGSNAAKAGLRSGDIIKAINGKPINHFAPDLTGVLDAEKGKEVSIQIDRGGSMQTLKAQVGETGKLGFYPSIKDAYPHQPYNWSNGIKYACYEGYELTLAQAISIGKMFTREIKVTESLASPIRIATIYGGTWQWDRFWRLTGLISFVLAFMNFLPIPALDGGHMMFIVYEVISGRPPSDSFLEKAQVVGFVMIMGLMVFAFGNDIYQLFIK